MRWSSTIVLLASAFQVAIVYARLPSTAAIEPSILFGRQTQPGCSVGRKKCLNVKSAATYCCLEDEECYSLENNTAAVCCPKGRNCRKMDPVDCFTVDRSKADKCGTKCCNLGYECVPGSTNICQIKQENVLSGAVPADWGDILDDDEEETASRTLLNCQPLVDKALEAVPKFPAFAIVVGFIPGVAAGILATFGGQWLWNMRRRKHQEKILAAQAYGGGRGGRRKRDTIFDDSLTYNPEREKDLFAIPRGFSFKRKGQPTYKIEMYEDDQHGNSQASVPSIPDHHKNPFVTMEEAAGTETRAPSAAPSQQSNTTPHPASAVVEHPPSVKKVKSMPQARPYHPSAQTSTDSFETYTSTATTRPSTDQPPPSKALPQVFDSLASATMPRSYIIPPIVPAPIVPAHTRHNSDATSIISDRDEYEAFPAKQRMRSNSSGPGGKGRGRAHSRPGTGYANGGRMYDVEEDEEDFAVAGWQTQKAGDGKGDYVMSPTVPPGLFRKDGDGGVPYP